MNLLPYLLIPTFISLAHVVGLFYEVRQRKYAALLQSFAAGYSIAYVFLYLLDKVRYFGDIAELEIMLVVLFGFIFFHSALKFALTSKSSSAKKNLLADQIHLLALGLYNLVISFSLIDLTIDNFDSGVVVTALLIIHFVLSDLSTEELHNSKLRYKSFIIIASTYLGGLLRVFDVLNVTSTAVLYAFAAGAIVYMTIREEVPDESKSRPIIFVLGALLFSLIVFFV